MKKINFSFTPRNILLTAFVAVEAVIFVVFNILFAVTPNNPIYLKYSGILLCLAVTASSIYFFKEDEDSIIMTAALIFTAISDLFILVLQNTLNFYIIGLITFLITQSIYLFRLYRGRKRIYITLFIRFIAMGVILAVMANLNGFNFLIAEVCVYIVMIVANCVDAWIICRKSRENLLFAIGMTLFVLCDICCGLQNAGMAGITLPLWCKTFADTAIWIFYAPSQVFIALSVRRGGLNGKVKESVSENEEQTPNA